MEPEKNILKNNSGKILQVNISSGGLPKLPVLLAKVSLGGVEGDRFAHPKIHGGPLQALLILANESLIAAQNAGFSVYPGALGENLTTTGLDPREWRSGQIFRAGSVCFELTSLRVPCRTLDGFGLSDAGEPIQKYLYDWKAKSGDPTSERWARGGFYARVLEAGEVAPGDQIVLHAG